MSTEDSTKQASANTASPVQASVPAEGEVKPWLDEGGHPWEIRRNVISVECPHCCFVFAAEHTSQRFEVDQWEGYDCPNCEGCPDAATTVAPRLQSAECPACGEQNCFDNALRTVPAPLADLEDEAARDDWVAWLRYDFTNEETTGTTIHVCDSDAKGAFKVYRAPVPTTASDSSTRARSAAEEIDVLLVPLRDYANTPHIDVMQSIIERHFTK